MAHTNNIGNENKYSGFFTILKAGGWAGYLLIARQAIYTLLARGRADENAYATVDVTAFFFIIYTSQKCL